MAARPLISLTMIVKNEEANLPRVLASAQGIADEIVVVDTGSTDRTVEVARALGAKVSFFKWVDDFSAARNFALEQATGEWVLILDGDDVAVETTPGDFRREVEKLADHVQFMRVPIKSPHAGGAGFTIFGSRRLLRNVPEIRWHHPVHEMLFHSSLESSPGVEVGSDALVIEHVGYADQAHRSKEQKGARNMRIIKRAIAQYPENSHWHYYLALQHTSAGHKATALRLIRSALRRFGGKIRPDFEGAFRCLGIKVARDLGRHDAAIKIGLPGVKAYAYSELCFELGLTYFSVKEYVQAERFLRLAISLRGRLAEYQTEAGTGSWKAMIQLGTIAWVQNQPDVAMERWRAACEWAPDQALTNLALGRGLAAAGRVAESEPMLRRAVERAPQLAEAQLALAEALIILGQHAEARERLDQLTVSEPGVARYWQFLGELLRITGDHDAAIDALTRGLQHHPREPLLFERLGLVLRTVGRIGDARAAFEIAAALDPTSTFARAGMLATAA